MRIFKPLHDKIVSRRQEEQLYFAAALSELQSGHIRAGLMAKAISASLGDEQKARAFYIALLAKAMRDEQYVDRRVMEEAEKNRREELKRKDREAKIEKKRAQVLQATANPPPGNIGKKVLWGGVSLLAMYGLLVVVAPPHSSHEDATLLDSYNKLVSEYESAHPQIDPGSDFFDQGLVDKINARVQSLENSGYSSIDALNTTMREFGNAFKHGSPAIHAQTPQSAPVESSRPCVFKSVMTDEDYYACGRNPPQTQ